MTIDEIFNTYENKIKLKSSPPEWLASINKSGLTRNITIQDWNSVIEDISHIASDCNTIDEFIRKYKEYIETKFKEYVTSEYFEEQFDNLDNNINNVYLKANAAYALAESNSTLITQKPTVYFESNFANLVQAYLYNVSSKAGDIIVLLEETQPDFIVLDSNVPVSGLINISRSDILNGNIPQPESGKIYKIEGVDNPLIAIESGIQTPATDSALNANSTNPVQNKVITLALQELENKIGASGGSITVEQEVNNSTNPVSSVAVHIEVVKLQRELDTHINSYDQRIGILESADNSFYQMIQSKQDKLTFDSTPTQNSTNPITSGAVKEVTDELKIKYKTLENSPEPFPLENNTVYIAQAPITKLYVDLPTDNNYICSLTFEVGEDYDIRLYRDDGEIMYLKPLDFESGELWEINIMNNIVASGKVSRKVVSE